MSDASNVDNATVMAAVLAMDAYNHNPVDGSWSVDFKNDFPDLVDGKLGTGNVIAVSTSFEQTYGNFFAIAYQFPTGSVISYRGTTELPVDFVNGYEIGGGSSLAPDAYYALSFYQSVATQENTDWQSSNISVTGHSLGGGLAGFVGAIYGLSGVLFDNMTFNNAAEDAYETGLGLYSAGSSSLTYGSQKPYPNVLSGLTAYATTGELLSIILPARFLQTPQVQYLNSYGGVRSPTNLHSMALLTMLLYAAENDDSAWQNVGKSLVDSLFDSKVADALGLNGDTAVFQKIIAYSAIASGYQPFGDAAIKSLFGDADKLGNMQNENEFTGALEDTSAGIDASELGGYFGNTDVPSPADALMEIAVQFAGDQAASAGAGDTSNASMTGVFSDVSSGTLTVNLDPTKWTATFGDEGQDKVVGVSDLIQGILYNILNIDSTTTVGGEKADNAINKFVTQTPPSEIDIALTSSASIDSTATAKNAYQSTKPKTIAVGQKDSGTITAGDGDNLIFGGQTVKVGNGNNIIVGEAGGETVTVGGGNNVVMATGAGNTINIEAKDSNPTNPGVNFIYAGDGSETLNFDTGQGDAGVIIQSVTNFSQNGLLDLDQNSLSQYINQELQGPYWQQFEMQYSNGLHNFDWTVILVPEDQTDNDKIEINGAGTNLVEQYYGGTFSIPGSTFSPSDKDTVFSIDNGAIVTNLHFPPTVKTIDLNDYLEKATTPPAPATPHANFVHADFATPSVSPGVTAAASAGDAVSIAQFESGASVLDDRFGGFSIADTAANVSAAIDDIDGDGNIDAITLTDPGTPVLQIDASQAVDDAFALGEITNSAFTVAVSDTAANVSADLDSLAADTRVSSITLTDDGTPTLALSAAQVVDDSAALAEITNSAYAIAVTDTAADASQLLDQLQANGHIASVTLTDSGDPTLDLSVAQLSADAGVLGTITNADYAVAVGDTAANVVANAQLLQANSHVSSVTVTDTAANVLQNLSALKGDSQVSAIQIIDTAQSVLEDESALAQISQISAVIVEDSAANVVANAQALSSDPQVSGIWVVDTAANLLAYAANLSADSQVQAQIVEDTPTAISASFDALNADSGITGIVPTGGGTPTLQLTATQALNDTSALGKVEGTNIVLDVVDTAADVAANLDALSQDQQVAGITLDDPTAQPLKLSATQVAGDFAILQTITNPGYAIAVTDTSENVATNLDALAANGHVASITLSDAGPAVLDLTASQAAGDGAALAAIQGPYVIAVTDRSSNVAAALDALNADPNLVSITLSDVMAPTLAVNATQAIADRTAIGKITNNDLTLSVTDTAANMLANAAALNSLPQQASFNVSDTAANVLADQAALSAALALSSVTVVDTAANVSANIDALEAAASRQAVGTNNGCITSITLTDAGTPTLVLTAAQAVADTNALLDISNGAYKVSVVDSAANVAANLDALTSDSHLGSITLTDATPVLNLTASQVTDDAAALSAITNSSYAISVTDSAANISASIDALNSNSEVTQISLTDPGTPVLTVSADQAVFDTNAFDCITGPYTVVVDDTADNVLADSSALSSDARVSKLDVVDTAADILANSAALRADSQITSVSVLDDAQNIVSDAQSLNADSQIASIVATASASEALSTEAGLATITAPLTLNVQDTAADISADLDALGADAQISSITLTDPEPPGLAPTLVVTAAQAVEDSSVILRILAQGASLEILDSAANISVAYDQISSTYFAGPLSQSVKIGFTDAAVPVLTLSAADVFSATSEIKTAFQIAVVDNASNLTRDAYSLNYPGTISSVTVEDTAANVLAFDHSYASIFLNASATVVDNAADVAAAFDAISADPRISSIDLTDSAPLTLSVTQALTESGVLSKIANASYVVNVIGSASDILNNAAALAAVPHVNNLIVVDNASDILANASALSAANNIEAINVVDTVANVMADIDALGQDSWITSIQVADTASNIASNLDFLDGAIISSIVFNGSTGPLALTVGEAAQNMAALNKMPAGSVAIEGSVGDVMANITSLNGCAAVGSIDVVDTAANIANAATSLNSDGKISSVTIQDNVANVLANSSAVSTIKSLTAVDVSDTAQDVGANLDALNADSAITSISVTDGSESPMLLTAAQAADDNEALDKIVGTVPAVEVSDTAANVSSSFSGLGTATYGLVPITSITLTDGGPATLTLSALQVAYYSSTLNLITNSDYSIDVVDNAIDFSYFRYFLNSNSRITSISIVDSAANVASCFDTLNDNPLVRAITLTDAGSPHLTLTASQATGDTSALAAITNEDYAVDISDTADNVLGAMSALQGDPRISTIRVVDTVANLLENSDALQASTGITSVEVSDTAQAVAANAATIADDSWISSVKIADYGYDIVAELPALSTVKQITAIELNPWSPSVDVDAEQAVQYAAVLGKITSGNIVVTDTAQNFAAAIDTISNLSAVNQVTLTDPGTATLNLSVQQVARDATALGAIAGYYDISIHDTVADVLANLSTIEANAHVVSIVVVDTSTAIANNKAALAGIGLISGYVDTDAQGNTVASYLANRASEDAAGQIAISDSSANVAANFDLLNSDPAITSITLTDKPSLTLTVAQALNDTVALKAIQNAGFTVTIIDSSSNVTANISALAKDSRIASINFTDAASGYYYQPTYLYLSAAQVAEGAAALSKIQSPNYIFVADTAADISAAFPSLMANHNVLSVDVTDSAALALTASEILQAATVPIHNANWTPVVIEAVDANTNIADVSPSVMQAGQTAIVGRLAPDLIGAQISLVQSPEALGTLSIAPDSSGDILYTAPGAVEANATDNLRYEIEATTSGDVLATADATVQLAAAAPGADPTTVTGQLTVAQNSTSDITSLIDSLVRPGIYGPVSITSVSDVTGEVSLANGKVSYAAPSSGSDDISYTVADKFGDAGSGSIEVSVDPGPSLSSIAPAEVGHGQTVAVGAATPGVEGDRLTLVTTQAPAEGSLSLVDGSVEYTATAAVPAGGVNDTFSYSVKDQFGDVSSPVTSTLELDPGPSAAAGSIVVGHAGSVDETNYLDSLVTPGLPGDQETISSVTGNAQSYGGDVTYTAPPLYEFSSSTVARYDSFYYTATDQLGESATGVVNVTIDPGPTVSTEQLTAGHDSTTDVTSLLNTLVAPGLLNDTETLTALSASQGTTSLENGTAIYTAPSGGTDELAYTYTDQVGDTATGYVGVSVDPGPTTGAVAATADLSNSVDLTADVIGAASPGLQGDALTITGIDTTGTLGTVSLENGDLVYAASGTGLSQIPANRSQADTFGYTISDQYGDTASGTAELTVANPATTIDGPQGGSATIQGTTGADVIDAYGAGNTIYDNGGNDVVNGGSSDTTVYAGSGNVVINLQGTSNQVIGADGNMTVSGSTGITNVSLGDGNNTLSLGGSGNTVMVGAGNNTIVAGDGGANVTTGAGTDDVELSGTQNTVTLNGSTATVSGGQGNDTIAVDGGNDGLTFAGAGSQANLNGSTIASITDLGNALRINIGSATQTDTISGFGSNDTAGLIDLQNGVGGYNSVNDVIAALHSDGNGGTALTLGTSGSIDFAGTAQNQLHAANFKVG